MLKKSLAVILSVCMMLSLFACSSDKKEEKSKNDKPKFDSFSEEFESNDEIVSDDTDITDKDAVGSVNTERLNDSCSMILCTGYDNNDYYELVANQIDGYPDSTFEFGVIKNNKWLIPMGSDCPFIDENGWWIGAESSNTPGTFKYAGSGCFYYECNSDKIVYKPETNVSVSVWSLTAHPNSKYPNTTYNINSQSEALVRLFDPYHEHKHPLAYVNMNTGETKILPFGGIAINQVGPVDDGLFFADIDGGAWEEENDKVGFFDLDGNLVIDMSAYNVVSFKNYRFTDGQYTFTALNNSNVRYDITIDTTGTIISQEKV